MLREGVKHRESLTVTAARSAEEMGSGDLPVLATPAMIALMEKAAMNAVKPFLGEGESSVGIRIDCSHTRATALGEEIYAEATITAVEGRRISFRIAAFDSKGEIGQAFHERFVVGRERFLSRLK